MVVRIVRQPIEGKGQLYHSLCAVIILVQQFVRGKRRICFVSMNPPRSVMKPLIRVMKLFQFILREKNMKGFDALVYGFAIVRCGSFDIGGDACPGSQWVCPSEVYEKYQQ